MTVVMACTLLSCSSDKSSVVAPGNSDTPAVRPNIVFLLADDMRADGAGYAGNPIVQTPNIDALAQQGVAFKSMYVTTPVCAISRASIFSGEYASRHGILDFNTDFSPAQLQETYPALLRAAGYRTGFIGKFGVGNNMPASMFDYWKGFPGQGDYITQDSAGRSVHLTHLQGDQALEFLRTQPKDRPFALSVSFKAPHVQDDVPVQFIPEVNDASLYSNIEIPVPATADDTYWMRFPAFFRANNLARERWKALFSTPEKYQASVKGYYQLITGLDRVVGQIRAELVRQKLDRNTVIIFSSDNGFFLGELGMAHKWYGQEPSVHVPLVIYDPRDPTGQNGRVESALALNIDIAPTILSIAGVPVPAQMEGKSLVPLVHGQAVSSWRTDFLFEHLFPEPMIRRSAGVIGGRYKYLRYLDPNPNYEVVYDLAVDPNETTNFATDPAYKDILDRLRRRYDELELQSK